MTHFGLIKLNQGWIIESRVGEWLSRQWLRLATLAFLSYLVLAKDVSIQFNIGYVGEVNPTAPASLNEVTTMGFEAQPVSLLEKVPAPGEPVEKTKPVWKDRRANTFSNLAFILNPSYATRHNISDAIVAEKMAICEDYVSKYASTAVLEMKKFGIPASITLAQGLLESNAGESRLSVESNNHFGMKCRSKCRGCTCRNYTDDDIYDMFRVFDSSWDSFREHSKLLTSARYCHLQNLGSTNYEAWSRGLKKAGYATDKRYAEKLIRIIKVLKLHRFDYEG